MSAIDEIAAQFTLWNDALKTGDPDNVLACYASDAILLPTMSNKVRSTHDGIRDYFVHFLAVKPVGRIDEQHIRIYDTLAINSGRYTFLVTVDGEEAEIGARFTFVYRKDEQGWMIIEHHSSQLPEAG